MAESQQIRAASGRTAGSERRGEPRSGPRVLGIWSIVLISVAAVLTLRNMPSIAEHGWSSIVYYLLGAVFFFFVPLSLVAAELETGWPKAGGLCPLPRSRTDDHLECVIAAHSIARHHAGPKQPARISMSSSNGRHRVAIVGSGFGGLAAAKALRRAPVDVTVIDRTNHHLFQPLLYQMATGILAAGDIAPPIRDILRRQANTRVLLGDVMDIDLQAREVTLETAGRRARVDYDTLIVATGAGSSYFGHDEFGVHAPGLKTIDDALEVRGRIFGAFELAELARDDRQRNAWLTIAVVGAGPTGVEVAGQIAELSRRALKRNFRSFDPSRARVILLDAADNVLPAFPESLQRSAHRDLCHLGVDTQLGTRVTAVDEYGLEVVGPDGSPRRIDARTKVWAAGVRASPLGARLAAKSGASVDRSGRVAVLPDCTLPAHPEVFVVGDLMSVSNLPGVAEVAMQSGRHAARTIIRRLRGDAATREFHYHDLGTMATVSRFRAVAAFGPLSVDGVVAWLLWLVVHLAFLTGFKNRVATLVRWMIAFLGRGRPERTITEQQVFARAHKLETVPGTIGA